MSTEPRQSTVYYCAATLDGYIADSDDGIEWLTGYRGSFDGPGAEAGPMGPGNSYERFYEGVGALVSGSKTYEYVAEHVGDGGEWPYAGKPYWVLSSRELSIPSADGADVRVTDATAEELHREMAEAAGDRNIWIVGGGGVASQFAEAGLLDGILVTIVPVVLGAGKPLFERPLGSGPMQLTGVTTFESGMVELRYEVPASG